MAGKKVDVRSRMEQLETLFGSQKAAAQKLGVGVSTFREYKTGRKEPSNQLRKKINDTFTAQKRHQAFTDEFLAKHQKRIQTEAKKRQAAAKRQAAKALEPVIVDARRWVMSTFSNKAIIAKLLDLIPEYAVHPPGDAERVQFLTAEQLMASPSKRNGKPDHTKNPYIGKPKGIQNPYYFGILSDQYLIEIMERQGIDVGALPSRTYVKDVMAAKGISFETDDMMYTVLRNRAPMVDYLTQTLSLETMLDYMERKFLSLPNQTGRRKYTPIRFIGYQL